MGYFKCSISIDSFDTVGKLDVSLFLTKLFYHSTIDLMSTFDYKTKRLDRNEARKLITKIMNHMPHKVFFSRHALEELKKDGLTTLDAINILKSPGARIYTDGEFEKGSYRYRLETTNMMVVVAFLELGDGMIIITAWDKRKK